MSVESRTVRESDAAEIVALLNPIIEDGTFTAMQTPFTVDDQREFIRDFPERGVYHVAVDNGSRQVVGLQDVLPTLDEHGKFTGTGEISTFVALGFHRRGIGSRLCDQTFAAAKKIGYSKLNATIRADNAQAVAFYVRQGFRIVGHGQEQGTTRKEPIEKILAVRNLPEV